MIQPYCNLHKGPHGKECLTPNQCYCNCHSLLAQTNHSLQKQIKYHEVQAQKLREIIQNRA